MDDIESPVFLGDWLKRRRKALDLTQDELAKRAGCSVFTLRKIESGERKPSRQLAGLLAQSLSIPSEEQQTFIRVARGELNAARLHRPALETPGLPRPASALPYLASKLPVALTPIVGRQQELIALGRLLRDPQCRLLTLTGTGGIGKTRLAIEVAAQNQEQFTHGICYVSLAGLSSPAFLIQTICSSLGLTLHGQAEPRAQLLGHLRTRQVLLVLDNAEHLLSGMGQVTGILEHAAGLKIMVTSRESLSLQGEWVFELRGLPAPFDASAQNAEEYGAVALFVQCAQRVRADFQLHPEDMAAVVHICQMVEGMPLGIELAAAWVSVLTCSEIAQEIEHSLDFLTTSRRDVPERQRSLRAVFEHSWSLLSEQERQALCRLGVFRGGFDREAAGQVAGASLPLLQALTAKSLVHRTNSGHFDLHEAVRQYAIIHFTGDQQSQAVRDRHASYYLDLLRNKGRDLQGYSQQQALQDLSNEFANLREAWEWAVKREMFSILEPALFSFGLLCDIRGWGRQGIELIEQVLQALKSGPKTGVAQRVYGQALVQQGLLFFRQGQHHQAQTLYAESLAILRPFGEPALLSVPLILSGIVLSLNGKLEPAQSSLDEGLVCARAAGERWLEALALFNQGTVDSQRGQYPQAYQQMSAGLELWRSLGDDRFTALGLNFISPVVIKLGHCDEAQVFLQESLSLCTRVGDRWGMGTAYRFLGLAAIAQGDPPQAKSLIQTSLSLFTELDARWDICRSLIVYGEAYILSGDLAGARRALMDAIQLAWEIQAMPLVMEILAGLAHLHLQAHSVDKSLRISLYVLSHPASDQEVKDRARRLSLEAQAECTDQETESARQWLASQPADKIVEYLLEA